MHEPFKPDTFRDSLGSLEQLEARAQRPVLPPKKGLPEAIGRFKIEAELGRGGMGVVYRARDEHLGRSVAIKLMNDELTNPVELERFRREAWATGRLVHPGIVRLYEIGSQRLSPYMVLELVEGGETLADRLRLGLTLDQALRAGIEVAEALAYVHAQGIVHRDLKPGNVLVRQDGGRAQLTDFGMAFDPVMTRVTKAGNMIGTLAYAAPEQSGDGAVGPSADMYSLGAMLYELVAGRPPLLAEGPLELLAKVAVEKPPPLADLVPDAPDDLCDLIHACLEKRPRARPTAEEALRTLRTVRADAPRRWRMPWRAVGATVGSIALITAGVALAVRPDAAPADDDPTPATTTVAERDPVADRSATLALDRLADLEPRAKHAQVNAWLAAHPGHPEEDRAREWLDTAQRSFPVLVLPHELVNDEPVAHPLQAALAAPTVLLSSGGESLRCWDLGATPALRWTVPTRDAHGSELRVVPGERVLHASKDGPLHLTDLSDGVTRPFRPDWSTADGGRRLALSQDRRHLAVAQGGAVMLATWPEGDLLWQAPARSVRALAFSPEGGQLAVAQGSYGEVKERFKDLHFLRVLNVANGAEAFRVELHAPGGTLAFAPDGGILVGDRLGNLVRVVGEPTVSSRTFLRAQTEAAGLLGGRSHPGSIDGMVMGHAGDRVYSVGQRGAIAQRDELRVWSYPDGEELHRIVLEGSPHSLSLSPDGSRLVVGRTDGHVEVWGCRR